MFEKFAEFFPVLVLRAFGWMLPASVLALVFVHLGRHGYLRPFADLFHAARSLSLVGWLCVAPLVVGLVGYASTKNDGGGTNDAPTHLSAPRRFLRSRTEGWQFPSTPVTPDEIAAGYRAPADGAAGIVAAPEGAVTNERWRLRGAYGDAFRLELKDRRFPYRDGVLTGVTVLARGEVRPDVGTLYFPVPPARGVSLLPESRWGLLSYAPAPGSRDRASVFWHAQSSSNSLLLTWENALVGRDPNCPTNLQAELYADGRFAWRTDGGSRLYLPVLEFDWDGDGLENTVDPDPLVAGPDAHGTNAEWYKVVCTNAFAAVDILPGSESNNPNNPNIQTILPPGVGFRENVNSNGVYFVDLVAEEGPAPIYVVSGQYSLLGSPVLVANPGVTNRVPLVIGVEYAVTSPVPFSVGLPMGGFAELLRDEPTRKTVKWPLDFSFTEESCRDGVRTYSVHVGPYDPGGHFSWEEPEGPHGRASLMSTGPSDSSCGCVSTYGGIVTFYCSPTCNCVGDCKARVSYYSFGSAFTATGGVCRCGFEDPGEEEHPPVEYPVTGGVSVSCSDSAVIFEDAYQDSPGVWKPRKSTRMRLSVSAWGGERGGTLVLSSENLGKLSPVACGPLVLPPSTPLRPGQDFSLSFICEAAEESASEGDIKVHGRFYENETGNVESNDVELTSVKVELRVEQRAPENICVNRHSYGVFELVECHSTPVPNGFNWRLVGGGVLQDSEEGSVYTLGGVGHFRCPLHRNGAKLEACMGDVSYYPSIQVLEPQTLRGENARSANAYSAGSSGAGMNVDVFVCPKTVSFAQIAIMEIPVQTTPMITGWYTNEPVNVLTHTTTLGAGHWCNVQDTNYAGCDNIQSGTINDPSPGTLHLYIPVGWHRQNVSDETPAHRQMSESFDMYEEIFEFSDAVQVRKFGHECLRYPWGPVLIDGLVVEE